MNKKTLIILIVLAVVVVLGVVGVEVHHMMNPAMAVK